MSVLTHEQAIRRLKRLANQWPKDLMLFADNSYLVVAECTSDGRYAEVDFVSGIPCDGGDPDESVLIRAEGDG